jgi:class 3 adenylate cyclase
MDPDQAIGTALALVEAAEAIDHAAVYDAAGALVDVAREEEAPRLALPEALDAALRREAERENVATADAVVAPGGPRVLVVVPLRAGGHTSGYVASLVSLDGVRRRVEQVALARFHDAPDSVYVVDRGLRVIADPGGRRSKRLASAANEEILVRSSDLLVAGALARSGEHVAASGVPMVAAAAATATRPWAVVAQVPRAEAYRSLGEMRRVVAETTAIAIAAALLLGLAVSRRITAPLAALTRFARSLSAREFGAKVEVDSRDELGVLARAMAGAAADLAAGEQALRRELAIRADLGRYLPGELVDQIVAREREVVLGGERREITILFADVVAFTPLVEHRAPEEIVAMLNELFTILTEIVFRHGGTVDKFIGDCVMAVWGAPTAQADHAARALAAAEDMIRWLETANASWRERYGADVRLAVGVHTGEAVVGNVGSETRMEYTAIGDAVNVAARLEALARPQQVLLSAATRAAAGEDFEYVAVGEHRLAGRDAAIELFELRTA